MGVEAFIWALIMCFKFQNKLVGLQNKRGINDKIRELFKYQIPKAKASTSVQVSKIPEGSQFGSNGIVRSPLVYINKKNSIFAK